MRRTEAASATGDYVFYIDNGSVTHGFTRTSAGFQPVDFPNAILTVALGINTFGNIVGDYEDSGGVTHGFLAMPQ